MKNKQMKIMGSILKSIPFDSLNEEWAQRNHGQSLDRLNERGGLGSDEALAIIEKRKWIKVHDDEAINRIHEHLSKEG